MFLSDVILNPLRVKCSTCCTQYCLIVISLYYHKLESLTDLFNFNFLDILLRVKGNAAILLKFRFENHFSGPIFLDIL